MLKVGSICPKCREGKLIKRKKKKKNGNNTSPLDFLACDRDGRCNFKKKIKKIANRRSPYASAGSAW